MRLVAWLRVSRAERRLSKPMFIVYAILAIVLCLIVWLGSLKVSKTMQSDYTKMQKQIESTLHTEKVHEELIE